MYCWRCEQDKPDEQFSWKKKNVKRQTECKSCRADYLKAHYEKNKSYYKQKARESDLRLTEGVRQKVVEYLQSHPCVDCGFSDIRALDFDHMRDKSDNISKMVMRKSGWDSIFQEIQKCEVRCANCHRIKTAKTHNHWRNDYAPQ